jgi:hypothetical protein
MPGIDGLNLEGKTTRAPHEVPARGPNRYLLHTNGRARVPLARLRRDFRRGREGRQVRYPGGRPNLALTWVITAPKCPPRYVSHMPSLLGIRITPNILVICADFSHSYIEGFL